MSVMLSITRCGLPALLSTALALASHAQAPAAASAPHLYVGLGAGYFSYQMPGQYTVNLSSVVPSVGLVLNSRWSVQASGAYREQKDAGSYTVTRFGPTGLGTNVTVRSATFHHTWAVPILARYALRQPTKRFQVDVLGGVTLVHDSFRRATTTDSAEVRVEDTDQTTRKIGVNAALGLGVRYALTPRLALTSDVLLTYLLNASTASNRLTPPSLVVGLRYTFGSRK